MGLHSREASMATSKGWRLPCALAAAAALSACGGGGGGGGDIRYLDGPNAEATAFVVLGVSVHEAITALDRLVARVGADALVGPDNLSSATCAGAGRVELRKVGASIAIEAFDCRLLPDDPFVLDGTWTLTVAASTYNPDGSCPGNCVQSGTVDASQARWGFGAPTERAGEIDYRVATLAGVRTVSVTVDGPFEVEPGVVRQASARVDRSDNGDYLATATLPLPNGGSIGTRATAPRGPVQITSGTRSASAGLGTTVEAALTGFSAAALSIPWSEFVD